MAELVFGVCAIIIAVLSVAGFAMLFKWLISEAIDDYRKKEYGQVAIAIGFLVFLTTLIVAFVAMIFIFV